ncbi:GyrI-like domain-containing protein [Pseudogracilibacillus auburnensis]|uniref:GyrI-like small molecule binding domain-containing protein n=1 Tax=Pseudogracilibacillus auburnensis TaxID=1494959 RepID=A0A2V3VXG7_9BACI|nr:GyrI-like domain-containing protein [Pseudogracilibacillus auburnensis]PXW85378.1 hypothetical protein DFR56_111146 [Pseudogracilibacillus auburnensis]
MKKVETKPLKTHDHRKIHKNIYQMKQGNTMIQELPALKFVSQRMVTSYHMEWDGHPEPKDEKWIAWKVANQLKQITKKELAYKFKRMPPEIVWHKKDKNGKWIVDQMLLVADCVTDAMYDRAIEKVKKNLRVNELPKITFVKTKPTLCAQIFHLGHYRDTKESLRKLTSELEEKGYHAIGAHREIYLKPAMACYPPEKCETIIRVKVEKVE